MEWEFLLKILFLFGFHLYGFNGLVNALQPPLSPFFLMVLLMVNCLLVALDRGIRSLLICSSWVLRFFLDWFWERRIWSFFMVSRWTKCALLFLICFLPMMWWFFLGLMLIKLEWFLILLKLIIFGRGSMSICLNLLSFLATIVTQGLGLLSMVFFIWPIFQLVPNILVFRSFCEKRKDSFIELKDRIFAKITG